MGEEELASSTIFIILFNLVRASRTNPLSVFISKNINGFENNVGLFLLDAELANSGIFGNVGIYECNSGEHPLVIVTQYELSINPILFASTIPQFL